MSVEINKTSVSMELSEQELEAVAGGALNVNAAHSQELIDLQANTLEADRSGVRSTNIQHTDDFAAQLAQLNQTGS